MSISQPLPELIDLEFHDTIWKKPINYKHLPFKCRHSHEYNNLFKYFPLTIAEEQNNKTTKDEEGFQLIGIRRKQQPQKSNCTTQPSNDYRHSSKEVGKKYRRKPFRGIWIKQKMQKTRCGSWHYTSWKWKKKRKKAHKDQCPRGKQLRIWMRIVGLRKFSHTPITFYR